MTPPLLASDQSTTVEQLGEAIADIAAGIHAAIYQLLVLLHEFDERKGVEQWLSVLRSLAQLAHKH